MKRPRLLSILATVSILLLALLVAGCIVQKQRFDSCGIYLPKCSEGEKPVPVDLGKAVVGFGTQVAAKPVDISTANPQINPNLAGNAVGTGASNPTVDGKNAAIQQPATPTPKKAEGATPQASTPPASYGGGGAPAADEAAAKKAADEAAAKKAADEAAAAATTDKEVQAATGGQ